jgi:hypothetical protein
VWVGFIWLKIWISGQLALICASEEEHFSWPLVGIATYYGLDGPGIESRWGAKFSAPIYTGLGAHPASCTMGTGSFPTLNWPGRGDDYQPPFSTEVKETVEPHLYSPFVLSWQVIGWTLPLTFRPIALYASRPVLLLLCC